jgi:hypothetical protein
VAHFGLPRRYFDLCPIDYRLVRAANKRPLAGQETLRDAGINEGELLQFDSREGRRVWRTSQALLDTIEQELRDRLVDEAWDRATEQLAIIESTQTGGQRVQQVRRLMDEVGGPSKLIDIGDKFTEALGLYRAASTWAKHALSVLTISAWGTLAVGAFLVYNVLPEPGCEPAPVDPPEQTTTTFALEETATPTAGATPTAEATPTATLTQTTTETATPMPTATPTQESSATPTATVAQPITYTPIPPCIRVRPDGWVAYIVKRGDTLFSLSRSSGAAVAEIQRVNCLRGSTIRTSERLWLPAIPEREPTTPTPPPHLPADLTVEAIRGLQVSCPDGKGSCVTQVSFSIVNAGQGNAGGFYIRIVSDPEQSVSASQLATGLAPGQVKGFTITTPPGRNCYDPDCTVCVIVDSDNDVTESNEGNNRLCSTSIG